MLTDPDYYRQCHEDKFQVVLGDSWFSLVTTVVEEFLQEKKTSHRHSENSALRVPPKKLQEALEDQPAGTNVTLFPK